ncbi:procollagen-lysine 5-dioxygenase [Aureococcus anophagefferens]|nr:procollagen-lysine 5-dioxygenase [Aureococcus anophagefferens]
MAALVEASALQPWAVLKAFAGGVARGEDTAFEWDPPDAPKSCTSWNEADTDAPEDEGQHLQHVLPTDEEHGGVGCFALDAKYRWTERTTDPDPVACGEQLLYSWGNWWLRRAFGPAARFLIIVRHPLACALATREFLKEFESPTPTLRTCLRNWVAAHAALDEDAVELRRMALLDDVRHGSGDACLLRIAFSDLVRDPAAVLERIGAELVDAPLHVAAEDVAAVVKEGDPDDKYRAMWREWPDRPFRWDENGTFELGSDKPAPPARREAGAAGIVAEFTEPLARLGFPRAFKDDWARTPPPEPAD